MQGRGRTVTGVDGKNFLCSFLLNFFFLHGYGWIRGTKVSEHGWAMSFEWMKGREVEVL